MKQGSIALGTTREINGVVKLNGIVSIQLLCDDLSGDTTFSIQTSLDKTNWDIIQVSGEDFSGTLSDGTPFIQSFNLGPSIYFKVVFDGATTGTLAYIHSGL